MRFLITADVHLSADHPERKSALEEILRIADSEACEYLLIAGDLFDAGIDVNDAKRDLRALFTGNDFQTFVIPGNHDATAFREEDYFGEDIEVLSSRPFDRIDLGDLTLLAIPFFEGSFAELIDDLRTARRPDGLNILLLHGTIATIRGEAYGEESRYLPFTPEELLETGVDFAFAGHIHSMATKTSFAQGECIFAYPGSPVSITTRETGRRGVWLFDSESEELQLVHLDTAHYVSDRIELSPGDAAQKLDEFKTRALDQDLDSATLLIEPTGFIEMDETEFFGRLESIVEGAGAAGYKIDRRGVESAKTLLESSLYHGFERKLATREGLDERGIREIVLKAMSREARG